RLETPPIVGAGGAQAPRAAEWLAVASDRAGRVHVQADLSVPGHPNIFVIGDAAAASGPDGKPLPGVAPVAKQQGRYVANLLIARAEGKTLPAFAYCDFGAMATIGRKHAVAQVGACKLSGVSAWVLWSLAHIYFLIGSRNRLAVAMNWCWNYVTFQRGTRLITGISGSRIEDVLPAVMTAPATAAELGQSLGGQLPRTPHFHSGILSTRLPIGIGVSFLRSGTFARQVRANHRHPHQESVGHERRHQAAKRHDRTNACGQAVAGDGLDQWNRARHRAGARRRRFRHRPQRVRQAR